eukprot:TRINITY_DN4761_c0_g2_i6.p1 TRINITY_DN4761_c0_g2~~TRINITY_DN4761_c0_g2_i6.p1  ORF type:complete len:577 (+),score=226.37 TRINITY_DN4761_c0_g2_i6:363-2093(+)
MFLVSEDFAITKNQIMSQDEEIDDMSIGEPGSPMALGNEESDDDDDFLVSKKSKNKGKGKKRSRFIALEADEDDDDEADGDFSVDLDDEDEDDDEDYEQSNMRKGPAKKKSRFIDDAADVDDDEADEDDGDEEFGYGEALAADDEDFGDQGVDTHRQLLQDDELDAEEIAAQFRERERMRNQAEAMSYDSDRAFRKEKNLPKTTDPNLWMIKCKNGKEKLLCASLLQKALNKEIEGTPLRISSALCLDHMKGYFYVEAHRESHVKSAIEFLQGAYRTRITMVPLLEMPDVVKIVNKSSRLEPGDWVRLRRGVYKGDIGRVVTINDVTNRAEVKFVPRLDLTEIENAAKENRKASKRVKNRVRPPQRLFNPEQIRTLGGDPIKGRDMRGNETYELDGDMFENGFMVKEMAIKTLQTQDVVPTVDELQKFQSSGDELDMDGLSSTKDVRKQIRFDVADRVIVVSGELKGLQGTVSAVNGDEVMVVPKHEDLSDEPIAFQVNDLRKHFEVGDHVKITAGDYEGETGMVLQRQEDIIVVWSDSNVQEFKAFAQDAKMAPDTMPGADMLGNYSLHDLVELE